MKRRLKCKFCGSRKCKEVSLHGKTSRVVGPGCPDGVRALETELARREEYNKKYAEAEQKRLKEAYSKTVNVYGHHAGYYHWDHATWDERSGDLLILKLGINGRPETVAQFSSGSWTYVKYK